MPGDAAAFARLRPTAPTTRRTLDRATLELVCSWGTGGKQAGNFDWLHYMAFDSNGNLYTGSVQIGHRIQKFVRLNGD